MALRSRSRAAIATSGPGRGPASDGRVRQRRPSGRRGARRHPSAPAEELRRRAELLFGERAVQWRESGNAPPVLDDSGGALSVPGDFGDVPSVLDDSGGAPSGPGGSGGALPVPGGSGDVPSVLDDSGVALSVPGGSGGALPVPGGSGDAPTATVTGPAPGLGRRSGSVRTVAAATSVPGGIREGAATPAGPEQGAAARVSGREPASDPDQEPASQEPGAPGWRERAGLALRERMPVWLQTRYAVERRGAVALAVVLVAAAVFAVQHFWAGRPQQVSAPQVVRAQAPFGKKEGGATAGPAAGASSTPGAQIVVDVSGKVRKPGIRRLPAGSRVADALRAAGGVRPGVSTEGLNRARFLVDGEQVVVGTSAGAAAPPAPAAGPLTGSTGTGPQAPVSLNTATADQLDTLPGVGPVLAQHIIDYRTQHGGFRSVDELREVNGIGDRRFTDLRDLVRP